MNSLGLSYNRKELDLSLAEEFDHKAKIVYKNEAKQSNMNILKIVADEIEKNSDLIVQLEFKHRGLLPSCTKNEIKTILEFFRYYADLNPLLKGETLKHFTYFENEASYSFVFSPYLPLSLFSLLFSPILTSKSKIEIIVTPDIAPTMFLIESFFKKEGFFNFNITLKDFFSTKLTERYSLDAFCSMVVYENGDLDSAVDTVTIAAWNNMMSFCLRHILVQESAYELFLAKLSNRILKHQWDLPSNYEATKNIKEIIVEMEKMLIRAKADGIDHIKMHDSFYDENSLYIKPIIFIDNAYWVTKYLSESSEISNLPVVCVQAFRTTKEALSIIKKLSTTTVSLWCNNNSISNEFALSAPVDWVWINGYGYINPAVGDQINTIYKKMLKGLLELRNKNILTEMSPTLAMNSKSDIRLEKLSKVQQQWNSYSAQKRASLILDIATLLNSTSFVFKDTLEEQLKCLAYKCLKIKNEYTLLGKSYSVTNIYEPFGVMSLYDGNAFDSFNQRFYYILLPCIYGNGIMYSTNQKTTQAICEWLFDKGLPILYNFSANSNEAIKTNDIVKKNYHLEDIRFDLVGDAMDIYCYNCKTIWNTFGETFST